MTTVSEELKQFFQLLLGAKMGLKATGGELVAKVAALEDEHHTMQELYDFRRIMHAHLALIWHRLDLYPVVKSFRHHDGERCFDGKYFIVTATLPEGQISNHYKVEHWAEFDIPSVEFAPEWDGHSSEDVLARMTEALNTLPIWLMRKSVQGVIQTLTPTETVVMPEISLPESTNNDNSNVSWGEQDIDNTFGFHKATVEGPNASAPVHSELRVRFREFMNMLDTLIPPGRAKSVVKTKMQEASMFSHWGIAETQPLVDEPLPDYGPASPYMPLVTDAKIDRYEEDQESNPGWRSDGLTE